jgi:cobalt-zinc-cadmium efflux system outer membrane protein
MRSFRLIALVTAGAAFITGCASPPRDRGAGDVNQLLAARSIPAAQWPDTDGKTPEEPAKLPAGRTLSLAQALEQAFSRSPLIREQYAELGMSGAEWYDAGKLPDLGLEYSRLGFADGHGQVTKGLFVALGDLLLMRSRTRAAGESHRVTLERVAARLAELEAEVTAAWYEHTAALQSAEIQSRAARAAHASAEYARSLHAAGNLPARAVAQELAAASGAAIAAARAEAHSLETRAALATLLGLPVRDDWQLAPRLPAPPKSDDLPADLAERALASRLDIAAARREAQVLEMVSGAARSWRWLGEFEAGYESEQDHGEELRGPTFRLTLPLFHWNRGGVLRAQAAHEGARARLAALELQAGNDVSLGRDRMDTARRIAEVYRATLVPQREAVSARTQEEVNFMLAGAFELLAARREQYEAYLEYIAAVRDYWLARVELRHASGGAVPLAAAAEILNLDDAPAAQPHHGHGAHR